MAKPLTGRKVLVITLAFFGIVISVNLLMATQAIRTFSGLVVKNGYVASQTFNARLAAQEALGWTVTVALEGENLVVRITGRDGQPVQVAELAANIGRATESNDDQLPKFAYRDGAYVAPLTLAYGNWNLWLRATARDGTQFRQTRKLFVKG